MRSTYTHIRPISIVLYYYSKAVVFTQHFWKTLNVYKLLRKNTSSKEYQLRLLFSHVQHPDTYTSPQFTAEPIGVIAAPGRPATLQCAVTGEPPPSVAWFREGGGEVVIGDRVTVDSGTGELTISSVELSDTGRYYCVASNAVGSVRSLSTSLDLAGMVYTYTRTYMIVYSSIAAREPPTLVHHRRLWMHACSTISTYM